MFRATATRLLQQTRTAAPRPAGTQLPPSLQTATPKSARPSYPPPLNICTSLLEPQVQIPGYHDLLLHLPPDHPSKPAPRVMQKPTKHVSAALVQAATPKTLVDVESHPKAVPVKRPMDDDVRENLALVKTAKPWPFNLPSFMRPQPGTTYYEAYGGMMSSASSSAAGPTSAKRIGVLQALLYGVPESILDGKGLEEKVRDALRKK